MKKYMAEGLGTFALVFFGTGAIVIDDLSQGSITHLGIAAAFGIVVMIMIFCLRGISGAHINPAVTVAFALTDRYDRKHLWPYVLAQIVGGLLASLALHLVFPEHPHFGTTLPATGWQDSFVLEVILTYFLMLVILMVSQNPSVQQYTAVAVGAIVFLEALVAGPITGASMNPARSIAPALISGQREQLWIYLIAPMIGAVLATGTWRLFESESRPK